MEELDFIPPRKIVGKMISVDVLHKIKSDLWMEGMNMTEEYQGVWVRFRDIERIIDKYMKESEETK